MHKYFFVVLLLFASNCFAQQEEFDPTKPTLPESLGEDYGEGTNSHGVYLNGIVAKPTGYMVILNGKVLHQGNNIEGYTIVSITKNSVILKPIASNNSKDVFEIKLSNLNFKQLHMKS